MRIGILLTTILLSFGLLKAEVNDMQIFNASDLQWQNLGPVKQYNDITPDGKNAKTQAVTFTGVVPPGIDQFHTSLTFFPRNDSQLGFDLETEKVYFTVVDQGTSGANLRMIYSSNGTSWSSQTIINESAGLYPFNPSIQATNTQAMNPTDWSFYGSAMNLEANAQGGLSVGRGQHLIVQADGSQLLDFQPSPLDFAQNSMFPQFWFGASYAVLKNSQFESVHGAGSTTSGEGVDRFNYYAYNGFDFNIGNYTNSVIPPQWYVEKFFSNQGVSFGGFNSPTQIDVDDAGNIYVANHSSLDLSRIVRRSAISKSTDNGQTWSEFMTMPENIATAYAATFTNEETGLTGTDLTVYVDDAYTPNAFVVTGVDQWSYFMRFLVSDGDNLFNYHIAEVYHDKGTWGIRKVADLNEDNFYVFNNRANLAPRQFRVHNTSNIANGVVNYSYANSTRGHELEATRTPEGDIVLKWIDWTGEAQPLSPAVTLVNIVRDENTGEDNTVQETMSEIVLTQLYATHRRSGDNSWASAKQMTNETNSVFYTRMPKRIKDIRKVPVIRFDSGTWWWTSAQNVPLQVRRATLDMRQMPYFGWMDATVAFNSVELKENFNFHLADVYPNPATSNVDFAFNIDESADVKLEIFDLLGNKVATVINNNFAPGTYASTFDVSALSTGSYFYSLNVNGRVLSKTLNVVK